MELLRIIYQEFRTTHKYQLAKSVLDFDRAIRDRTCSPKQAVEFQGLLKANLSSTDPEAAYWLEQIDQKVQEVLALYNQTPRTDPYLISRPGEVRVKRWAKHRWNDAEPAIKRVVEAYISAGWNLEDFDHWNRHGAEATLEKHDTLNKGEIGWHHSKTLLIDKTGKVANARNGKSFITA